MKQAILFGGKANTGNRFLENLNDTWSWDGKNWQQRFPINLPPARSGAKIVYDRERKSLLLFGGEAGGGLLDDTWVWNNSDWIEMQPVNHPSSRADFGMAYHEGKQQIILFGGQTFDGLVPDTWVWDGHDWAQLQTVESPPPQIAYGAKLIYLPDLQAIALYNSFREKIIVSDENFTMTERSEIWVLDY